MTPRSEYTANIIQGMQHNLQETAERKEALWDFWKIK